MAAKIFINYRRGEDAGTAGRLYDRLEQDFPREDLFMDVDNIAVGANFVAALDQKVVECDVLLAVIGKNWLDVTDSEGNKRLDDPNDFERVEIESALRFGKRIIPVLINDAQMPQVSALPESLKPLAWRNAVRLTHERFRSDAQGLISGLKVVLAEVEAERAARTEVEHRAAEEARKRREADEVARVAELERKKAERARGAMAQSW